MKSIGNHLNAGLRRAALHPGAQTQTAQVRGGQLTRKAGASAKAPNAASGAVEMRPADPVPGI